MSKIAGFNCPTCHALLPYRSTRWMIVATIDELDYRPAPRRTPSGEITCRSCGNAVKVKAPSKERVSKIKRLGVALTLACVVIGLAAFSLLRLLIPEWIALAAGVLIAFAPLFFLDAYMFSKMADLRQKQKRAKPAQ